MYSHYRAWQTVTANASLYAIRHQVLGLLYVGKTRYTREVFAVDTKRFFGFGWIVTIQMT